MRSYLEIYDLGTDRVETVLSVAFLIEAPNWVPDDGSLIVNGNGRLHRVPLDMPALHAIDTGGLSRINNDHGVAPVASLLAVSDSTHGGKSCIYTLPIEGDRPRRVTAATPSWWHGWSPDGARLAYTAVRNGEFCIATCAMDGSGEAMVIGGPHHYDGPDYSPDGDWIWFNSDRGGNMQIWRVRSDGRDPQQMTDDASANWFPHPSPDGRHVLYLAYAPGTADIHRVATLNCGCWNVPPGRSDRLLRSLAARERSTCPAGRRTASELRSCAMSAKTGGRGADGSSRTRNRSRCRSLRVVASEAVQCAQGLLAMLRALSDEGRWNGGINESRNARALATRGAGLAMVRCRCRPRCASMLDAGIGNR